MVFQSHSSVTPPRHPISTPGVLLSGELVPRALMLFLTLPRGTPHESHLDCSPYPLSLGSSFTVSSPHCLPANTPARPLLLDLRMTPSPVPASRPPRPESLTFLGAFLWTQMASPCIQPSLLLPMTPFPRCQPTENPGRSQETLAPQGGRTKMFTWKGTFEVLKI